MRAPVSHSRPPLPAGWLASRRRWHQHRVDLVLHARAGAHELGAAREAPAHHAHALIRGPDAIELAGPQQLGQRARVEAICLRARLTDPGVGRRDDDHPRDVRLEDPRDRPRVAGDLQGDPVTRIQARREQLKRLGPRLDAARRPQPSLRDDRDLTEIPMNIQRYRSHTVLPRHCRLGEKRWANDIDGSALAAQPGKSQGRPMKSPGSTRPSRKTACPACVLPRRPLSQSTEPKSATGRTDAFNEAVSCRES